MGEVNESSMAITQFQMPASRPVPFREDCWSEEATSTLVDAWGRRYLELNRGNLRQKDWQEVADAVNALHGQTKKTRRTDVQCKNRIDTLKKKYKVEKAKIGESNGMLMSSWPFYIRLDELIGSNLKNQTQKVMPLSNSSSSSMALVPMAIPLYNKPSLMPPVAVQVEPGLLPQKRKFSGVDDSYFRKNYSAMAAAAAAEEEEVEEDVSSSEEDEEEIEGREDGTGFANEGMRKLAKAIERFGEVYEKVENMKQKQMVELEKQRMQFVKDLEVQRMQLFMDTQVQLEKVKHTKRSRSDDM